MARRSRKQIARDAGYRSYGEMMRWTSDPDIQLRYPGRSRAAVAARRAAGVAARDQARLDDLNSRRGSLTPAERKERTWRAAGYRSDYSYRANLRSARRRLGITARNPSAADLDRLRAVARMQADDRLPPMPTDLPPTDRQRLAAARAADAVRGGWASPRQQAAAVKSLIDLGVPVSEAESLAADLSTYQAIRADGGSVFDFSPSGDYLIKTLRDAGIADRDGPTAGPTGSGTDPEDWGWDLIDMVLA